MREPYSARINDGPYGMRPLLKAIHSYPKEKRKEFLEVLEEIKRGKNFDEACSRLQRYQEVKLFEDLTKELLEAAERYEVNVPLSEFPSFNRREDFERTFEEFRSRGLENKVKEQFNKLKKWEEIYKMRKKKLGYYN